jgi:hypothetical protein
MTGKKGHFVNKSTLVLRFLSFWDQVSRERSEDFPGSAVRVYLACVVADRAVFLAISSAVTIEE